MKAFFPNAVGVLNDLDQKTADLKAKRKVTITELNPNPIADPIKDSLSGSQIHKIMLPLCAMQMISFLEIIVNDFLYTKSAFE